MLPPLFTRRPVPSASIRFVLLSANNTKTCRGLVVPPPSASYFVFFSYAFTRRGVEMLDNLPLPLFRFAMLAYPLLTLTAHTHRVFFVLSCAFYYVYRRG